MIRTYHKYTLQTNPWHREEEEEGGLNAFYWRQIFALDSVVVETQNCLARMEVSLLMQCNTTENNQIKVTDYGKTKKRPMTHR